MPPEWKCFNLTIAIVAKSVKIVETLWSLKLLGKNSPAAGLWLVKLLILANHKPSAGEFFPKVSQLFSHFWWLVIPRSTAVAVVARVDSKQTWPELHCTQWAHTQTFSWSQTCWTCHYIAVKKTSTHTHNNHAVSYVSIITDQETALFWMFSCDTKPIIITLWQCSWWVSVMCQNIIRFKQHKRSCHATPVDHAMAPELLYIMHQSYTITSSTDWTFNYTTTMNGWNVDEMVWNITGTLY